MPIRAADITHIKKIMRYISYPRPIDFPYAKQKDTRFDAVNITLELIKNLLLVKYYMIYDGNTLMKCKKGYVDLIVITQLINGVEDHQRSTIVITYPVEVNGLAQMRDDGTILITGTPMIIEFAAPDIHLHIQDRSRLSIIQRFRDNNITYEDEKWYCGSLTSTWWFHDGKKFKKWVCNRSSGKLEYYWKCEARDSRGYHECGEPSEVLKWYNNGGGYADLIFEL